MMGEPQHDPGRPWLEVDCIWGSLWVGSCLPTPVMFIESNAVTDSESEVYMPDGDNPSDSDPEVAEESESDEEAAPDFSVEPGEYCADETKRL
ncbi:hypothetical protein ON010_g12203 [Phytophthora cinnamomi]|nr:hypothetical protein ON010_g12203 [Phytophthora cinnamomi]